MSRTKSTLKNLVTALIGQLSVMIIGFFARAFFLKYLSEEYLGLNGLFTNILTILSLVELGV
ncbi:MAG: sugar translocase, partial [Oscillospiraceae bacterium]|nr:sugar translocase [Oscillospiraceae bacterium]